MNDYATKWCRDPVPVHMGTRHYFAIITTGRMRYIAWIENDKFVTTLDNGEKHTFDNVAGWIPLPYENI